MSSRRVVVTGMGMVTPLGCGVDASWRRLIAGQSGIRRIDRFEVDDLPAKIAGLVPTGEGEGAFRIDEVMAPKEPARTICSSSTGSRPRSRPSTMPTGRPRTRRFAERTGVLIGSGIGGLSTIADTAIELEHRGPRRVSPFFIPAA